MDRARGDRTVVRLVAARGEVRLRFRAGTSAATVLGRVLEQVLADGRGRVVVEAPEEVAALLRFCGLGALLRR